ncbi:MAG: 30S ribosomal protein S4 [Candidatus Poseidoniales archaeon]|nr:30S ribosomal protein S4 [Candidatus Poseidoniales archaeon]
MGHPKFARPKYDTPTHPWKKARIEEEHALKEQFGLKKIGGMKEIWKGKSKLRRWRQNAMKLIGRVDTSEGHFSREKDDLVESLYRRGLLGDGATLDDILLLTVEHVLSRRLQSQVYYCGLATSMRQARQLVIHGHIGIGDQKMTVPSYIITRDDENLLTYHHTSPLTDTDHPIRKEIEETRAAAEYEEEDKETPSEEFVAGVVEAAETAPSAEDTEVEGGDA